MSRRASFTLAELRRAMKAAREAGWAVEIDGATIKLLPTDPGSPLPSAQTDSDWQRALDAWRRSA